MRWAAGSKFCRIRLHLKSGSPKASDSAWHMQGCGDQQPLFTGLWFEHRGRVHCILESRPWSGLQVNTRRIAAEKSKSFEDGRAKPAEDEACLWVVLAERWYCINPEGAAASQNDDAVRGDLRIRWRESKSVFKRHY